MVHGLLSRLLILLWLVGFGLELFEYTVGLSVCAAAPGRLHLNGRRCCIFVERTVSERVRRRPHWSSRQFQKSSISSSRLKAFVILIGRAPCLDHFLNLEYR